MIDFNGLLSSPQFMMGLGLLANRGDFKGGLLGANYAQQMQALAQKKQQEEARKAALQNLNLNPQQQAMAQAFPNQFAQAYVGQQFEAPAQRRIITDGMGRQRYADTQEFVFSDMQGYDKNVLSPAAVKQKMDIARSGASNITNVLGGKELTPGQEALDKEYAKQVVGFEAGGEYADTEKMIGQLEEAFNALGDESNNLTGPVIGHTPDSLLSVLNPDAVSTREAVEEVVQRNLKAVLGAQFTEKEGERLIARAFNPKLDEKENQKRVGRLINQMKKAYAAKKSAAEYFKQNGTIRGWQGTMPSITDFYQAIEKGASSGPSVDDLLKKYGG